ncbi:unnamed protein product [Leptidea sinapis]|uniref:HTH CENPB-type domain-containing protein n=1 Tax=Leptidea sinapis TaxID=189913 RepID=A0A5E4R3B4_9NEOP|nr:unnamed protein product [Leptidea sinapis]
MVKRKLKLCKGYSEMGLPVTARILRRLVYKYCEKNNIKHNFNDEAKRAGKDWFKAFMKRHHEISVRKAQFMNPARAQKLNKYTVDDNFKKLRDIYDKFDLYDHPEQIYNMDEKGGRLTIHHQQGCTRNSFCPFHFNGSSCTKWCTRKRTSSTHAPAHHQASESGDTTPSILSEASTPDRDQENVPPINSGQQKSSESTASSPSILKPIPIPDVSLGNISPVNCRRPATPEQTKQSPAIASTSTGQVSRESIVQRSYYRTVYGTSSSSDDLMIYHSVG